MMLNDNNFFGAEADFYPYKIDNSLRVDDGDNAALTKTFGAAGNRQTWTLSGLFTRGNLGGNKTITFSNEGAGNFGQALFLSDDRLYFASVQNSVAQFELITTAKYRDMAAELHVVLVIDTTQSTASDRVRIYVNGSEVTAFDTAIYPAQNTTTRGLNTTALWEIGRQSSDQYDGYMSELIFVDGQALGASSFGEFKQGVWIPKAYEGTYGTNGFFLDFEDSGNLGNDVSGNNNDWTSVNLTANDQVLSSVTNRFSTLTPLVIGTSNLTLAEGNLKANAAASGSGSNWGTSFSTFLLPISGKFYVEGLAFINAGSGNNSHLGVLDSTVFEPSHSNITYAFTTGEGFDGIYASLLNDNVQPVSDGVLGTAEGTLTGTTIVTMLAIDIDAGKVWAGYDGTWLNSGDPSAGTGEIALRTFSLGDVVAVGISWNGTNDQGMFTNFGQDSSFAGLKTAQTNSDANGFGEFQYSVPTGFLSLCTENLTPIPMPYAEYISPSTENEYFEGTYTGNGSADGPFVYMGFKATDIVINGTHYAAGNANFDFNANGVKLRAAGVQNNDGVTYTIEAWVDEDFKYANAGVE